VRPAVYSEDEVIKTELFPGLEIALDRIFDSKQSQMELENSNEQRI